MKMILVGLVLALCGVSVHASGVAVSAGESTLAKITRTNDASGNPVLFNDDKPWKVFAFEYQTTPVQVVDGQGKAPKNGIIDRICLESAPAIPLTSDWVQVWDTNVAANMTAAGTGHRVAPPIVRLSGVQSCLDIRSEFKFGLGVMQGAATGSSYIYWK